MGVGHPFAAQPVNAVGNHQYFAADFLLGPTLDQTDERQVRTVHRGQISTWQTDGLGRRGVIGREVLHDLDGGVGHVTDTDNRRRGLCVDEIANVVEAVSDARVAGVVNQNKN